MIKQCIANKQSTINLLQMIVEESEDEKLVDALIRVADKINEMPECKIAGVKGKVKRKAIARDKYLSYCMGGKEKGGLALTMKQCSPKFKDLSERERTKYQTQADNENQ